MMMTNTVRVCGVDEVGRGPLAGPVVAAAVILDPCKPIEGLRDSKKLSASARHRLSQKIRENAYAFAIAQASVEEIDRLNILHASLLAMSRAVAALSPAATYALIDGNRTPELAIPSKPIVGGDALEPAISAASILAKCYRDALMCDYARQYPGYGFERHAGYPTAAHIQCLNLLGPCAIHRQSFGPVKAVLCIEAQVA